MKRKPIRNMSLALLFLLAAAAIEAQVYNLPPENESQMAYVALRYLLNHGWRPIYIQGILLVSADKYSINTKRVLVVQIPPSASILEKWKYYEEGLFSFMSGLYTGWSLCKTGYTSITILDRIGTEHELTESSYHP